ncbi:iron ABC transporter substrate-binding protein [Aquipuribacter nitratireducens]|uniref:Iron ABC transporter substrate-binding protein n=1 Tax=Aquipuribacter nitratireducens TaxID=650104 RepID=A0ABW0GN54_9MICO
MSATTRRAVAVACLVAGLTAGLAACGSDRETLTVYSGRTENLIGPLLEQFAEENDVDVDVRYGDSADLALLLEQEGDSSPADVVISQSPGAVGYLDGLGALAPIDESVLGLVDPAFRADDGSWVGMSGRVRTLVYDTDAVDPADLPDSVLDLTDPQYAGRVAVAPSNGSFQDFVTALRETQGDDVAEEWLRGMAENDSPTYANNTAIVQAVGRGEVPMGLVNHYYNYRALAEDPGIGTENYFFADGDIGNLVITTGVGKLATADSPELADSFIRFVLGEEAQTFFSDETFEYPLAAGVEPSADLPPLEGLGVATFDVDGLGGGLARTRELIASSGLDG